MNHFPLPQGRCVCVYTLYTQLLFFMQRELWNQRSALSCHWVRVTTVRECFCCFWRFNEKTDSDWLYRTASSIQLFYETIVVLFDLFSLIADCPCPQEKITPWWLGFIRTVYVSVHVIRYWLDFIAAAVTLWIMETFSNLLSPMMQSVICEFGLYKWNRLIHLSVHTVHAFCWLCIYYV